MTTPTPRIGFPKKGTLLTLPPGTWLHGEGTLRLRMSRVMTEISKYEDDMVWIEGTRLSNERRPTWIQILVSCDALTRNST